jgi:hypothetical protein
MHQNELKVLLKVGEGLIADIFAPKFSNINESVTSLKHLSIFLITLQSSEFELLIFKFFRDNKLDFKMQTSFS